MEWYERMLRRVESFADWQPASISGLLFTSYKEFQLSGALIYIC